MIEFKNISKTYGNTQALNDVSFQIKDGQIFGLIGHNGAGKSTTIKILVSIINQTAGNVIIDGQALKENRGEIKQKIGYVADTPNTFLRLKASEYWELMGTAYEVPAEQFNQRLTYFTELFGILDNADELIDSFSHGMRQKTFLVGALLANPKIWVLDEPMTGLDPQAAFDLKQMMQEHAAAGNIVLFSTHNLENAEELCDEIIILRKGQILYNGTIPDLQAQNENKSLETIYLRIAGREADEKDKQTVKESEIGGV
jgi:ABC-2 type transport system ATP-binding protein